MSNVWNDPKPSGNKASRLSRKSDITHQADLQNYQQYLQRLEEKEKQQSRRSKAKYSETDSVANRDAAKKCVGHIVKIGLVPFILGGPDYGVALSNGGPDREQWRAVVLKSMEVLNLVCQNNYRILIEIVALNRHLDPEFALRRNSESEKVPVYVWIVRVLLLFLGEADGQVADAALENLCGVFSAFRLKLLDAPYACRKELNSLVLQHLQRVQELSVRLPTIGFSRLLQEIRSSTAYKTVSGFLLSATRLFHWLVLNPQFVPLNHALNDLEQFGTRMWFVLAHCKSQKLLPLSVIDQMCSELLESFMRFAISTSATTATDFLMLTLSWVNEALLPNSLDQQPLVTKSVCYCLLSFLLFYLSYGLQGPMVHYIPSCELEQTVDDPVLLHVLGIVCYFDSHEGDPERAVERVEGQTNLFSHTDCSSQVLHREIGVPELDELRLRILQFEKQVNNDSAQYPDCRIPFPSLDAPYCFPVSSISDFVAHLEPHMNELDNVPVQLACLQYLQTMVCCEGGKFDRSTNCCSECAESIAYGTNVSIKRPAKPEFVKSVIGVLQQFLETPVFNYERKLQIYALKLLYCLFRTFQPHEAISTSSPIWRWLLSCISTDIGAPVTEVSNIWPLLVCSKFGEENFATIYGLLSEVKPESSFSSCEVVIASYGTLACVSEGDMLNAVLISLVTLLASRSQFVVSLAVNELENVARARKESPWQLIYGFIPTVSVAVIQHVVSMPQLPRTLCALLGISVRDFYSRTAQFTVPYLVCRGLNRELETVASMLEITVAELCLDNVPVILAQLLTSIARRDCPRSEVSTEESTSQSLSIGSVRKAVMELLVSYCPDLSSVGFKALVRSHWVELTWEIIKCYDYEVSRSEEKDKVPQSIIQALLVAIRSGSSTADMKDSDEEVLARFFHADILGLVHTFSDVVNDRRGRKSTREKIQNIRCVSLLAMLSGGALVFALPRLLSSLQITLNTEEFVSDTLKTWGTILDNLTDESLGSILDITVSVILQRWSTFTDKDKEVAKQMLEWLVTARRRVFDIRKSVGYPLFGTVKELEYLDGLLTPNPEQNTRQSRSRGRNREVRKTGNAQTGQEKEYDIVARLSGIYRRCNDDNIFVVRQALSEIEFHWNKEFSSLTNENNHDEEIRENGGMEVPSPASSTGSSFNIYSQKQFAPLVRSVTSAISKFRDVSSDIPQLGATCLGLIGAAHVGDLGGGLLFDGQGSYEGDDVLHNSDPDTPDSPIVLSHFNDVGESTDFIVYLLKNHLLKAFWSSDPSHQPLLAYAVQECIRLLGITPAVLSENQDLTELTPAHYIWDSFSPSSQSLLTPFLTSKYALQAQVRSETPPYPVYDLREPYAAWLFKFVSCALLRACDCAETPGGSGVYGAAIFKLCYGLKERSIMEFILPYCLLECMAGYDDEPDLLLKLITGSLKIELSDLNSEEQDNVKHCYEIVFRVIDYFKAWLHRTEYRSKVRSGKSAPEDSTRTTIEQFLDIVPVELMARKSLECESYARAVLYFEQHLRADRCKNSAAASDSGELPTQKYNYTDKQLLTLQKLYSNLNDPDKVAGVLAVYSASSLDSIIAECKFGDNWQYAIDKLEVDVAHIEECKSVSELRNWADLINRQEKRTELGEQVSSVNSSSQNQITTSTSREILASDFLTDEVYRSAVSLAYSAPLVTEILSAYRSHFEYDKILEKLSHLSQNRDPSCLPKEFIDWGIEASWNSLDYSSLCKWLDAAEQSSEFNDIIQLDNYLLGKSLRFLYENNYEEFDRYNYAGRELLSKTFPAMSRSSLGRKKGQIALHGLCDLSLVKTAGQSSLRKSNSGVAGDLLVDSLLQTRLGRLQGDFESQWYLLSLKRAALYFSRNSVWEKYLTESWVQSIKIARKKGAFSLVRKATSHVVEHRFPSKADFLKGSNRSTGLYLQVAKSFWAANDQKTALRIVRMVRDELRKDSRRFEQQPDAVEQLESSSMGTLSRRNQAKVQLTYARWIDLSAQSDMDTIVTEYQAAIDTDKSWGKPHYLLGRYFDKIYNSQLADETTASSEALYTAKYQTLVCMHYVSALACDGKHMYELMPKIITFWLSCQLGDDLKPEGEGDAPVAIAPDVKSQWGKQRDQTLRELQKCMLRAFQVLPKYMLYLVLGQILSRLGHRSRTILSLVKTVVASVVNAYPERALWFVLAQQHSTDSVRKKRADAILAVCDGNNEIGNGADFVRDYLEPGQRLFAGLVKVCGAKIAPEKTTVNLFQEFGLNPEIAPCRLVVPIQRAMMIGLPETGGQKDVITIRKFGARCDIFKSLRRPRKLQIQGSDGRFYNLMCKNDDLRKDSRLMDFTTSVNRLLRKHPDAASRNLGIMTYMAVPLNEKYGMIEFVPNVKPLREIFTGLYAARGNPLRLGELKTAFAPTLPKEKKIASFRAVCQKYPPVLYHWFLQEFPEANTWYTARNVFARSTAVMSMVGYVLGLGDRHSENLLLSEVSGSIFHVDFDCLFEMGTRLKVPERVPFRLTANMVDAFGVTGYEGTFRKTCEVTLEVVRGNENILMNILEPFIHDPVMDWTRLRKAETAAVVGALNDGSIAAAEHTRVRNKIRGLIDVSGLPISVAGQVQSLIVGATSEENLGQMYFGWLPFL